MADLVDHRGQLRSRQPVNSPREQRRPQLLHEPKRRIDILCFLRNESTRVACDRQVELRAESLYLLEVILAIVVLPVAMRRPDIDGLESRRNNVLHDLEKMLGRSSCNCRVIVGHPVRRAPIIQGPTDVIRTDKADGSHSLSLVFAPRPAGPPQSYNLLESVSRCFR